MNFTRMYLSFSVALLFLSGLVPRPETFYAVADIHQIGSERVARLKTIEEISWWVEVGSQLLVLTDANGLEKMRTTARTRRLPIVARPELLRFISLAGNHREPGMVSLAEGGRMAVVQLSNLHQVNRLHQQGQLPFVANTVLVQETRNRRDYQVRSKGSGPYSDLVAQIDGDRWFSDVETLAGFNRWTHGSEILDARDWLVGQFEDIPNLTVSTQAFQVSGTTAYNVIATLVGDVTPDEFYIVGAHYDSTSQTPTVAAPGAEDNGSGTAGVLEMARALSGSAPDSTIIFICYSGEEQGLLGSVFHASGLVAAGQDDQVGAALIMDMIGYTQNGDLECLLETNQTAAFLFPPLIEAARTYTLLDTVTSLNPFGSDHVPYLNRAMPALLTIENDWAVYPGYHNANDLPFQITIAMGRETLKMNTAVIGELAGSDSIAVAGWVDYLLGWNKPTSGTLVDANGNGFIDVVDILAAGVI